MRTKTSTTSCNWLGWVVVNPTSTRHSTVCNRKFVLFPQLYIYGLFVKDETDNVLLATYNMIKDLDFELAKQTPDNSFSIILC
jgi:hypothetical protein